MAFPLFLLNLIGNQKGNDTNTGEDGEDLGASGGFSLPSLPNLGSLFSSNSVELDTIDASEAGEVKSNYTGLLLAVVLIAAFAGLLYFLNKKK